MTVPLPTKSQLRRVGKALAAGTATPEDELTLAVYLGHCDTIQRELISAIEQALPGFPSLTPIVNTRVLGRAKTQVTLVEKLRRLGGHMLPTIRDAAGLRIVGDMNSNMQTALLPYIMREAFDLGPDEYKVIDRRVTPSHGYRALHAEFSWGAVPIELQIRTELQDQWAEMFERLADMWGRQIRYGEPPDVGPVPAAVQERFAEEHGEPQRPYIIRMIQRLGAVLANSEDAAFGSREGVRILQNLMKLAGEV